MESILSQRTQPHANTPVGFSKYLIHAMGSSITLLAEIMGLTPIEVNERLKTVQGFSKDSTGEVSQVMWEKIVPAFPEWSAQYIEPYNNQMVLEALSKGRFVIVLTESALVLPGFLHAVRYVGNGMCHDPFTGKERPTSDFPDVKAFVVVTHLPKEVPNSLVVEQVPVKDKVEGSIPSSGAEEINVQIIQKDINEAILLQLHHIKSATKKLEKLLK